MTYDSDHFQLGHGWLLGLRLTIGVGAGSPIKERVLDCREGCLI